MRLLLAILAMVVVPLLLQEIGAVAPWLAERLVRWATRWLPSQDRERFEADWLGELDAIPGQLIKLVFAFHVLVRAPAMQRALAGREPVWVEVSRRLLAMLITVVLASLRLITRLGNRLPNRGQDVKLRQAKVADLARIDGVTFEFTYGGEVRVLWGPKRVLLSPTTPLDRIGLHPRTVHTLRRAGIGTWGQLVEWFALEGEAGMVGHIRNFGRRDMNEVIRVLEQDPVDPTPRRDRN